MAKVKVKSKKPEKHYSRKEPEVFWYLNVKGDTLWGFRHRYYDAFRRKDVKSLSKDSEARLSPSENFSK